MHHRGRTTSATATPGTAVAAGAACAPAALTWMVVGVPTFVKHATDLDATPSYEDTFTVLVDATTAAPLAEPIELPSLYDRSHDRPTTPRPAAEEREVEEDRTQHLV